MPQAPKQSIIQRIKSRLTKKSKGKKIVFKDCTEVGEVPVEKSKASLSLHPEVSSSQSRKRSSEDIYQHQVPSPNAKRSKSDISSSVETVSSTAGCSHWIDNHAPNSSGDASPVSLVSSNPASPVTRKKESKDYADDKLENLIAYGTSGNLECEMDIHYSTGFSTVEMIEEMDRRHEERRMDWEDAELPAIFDEPFDDSSKGKKKKAFKARKMILVNKYGSPVFNDTDGEGYNLMSP